MTAAQYREAHSPARVDGIGIALRRAFAQNDGADDFAGLLQKLDHKTGY